jgi:hypothetical protein
MNKVIAIVFLLFFSLHLFGEASAEESTRTFKETVKEAIKKLSPTFIDPLSKGDANATNTALAKIVSDSGKQKSGPNFGIGVLDRDGIAVAGKYITGVFKKENFSKYSFVIKAFKKKKVVQDRLYFQDRSEFYVVCAPLVSQGQLVGALVLGFTSSEVNEKYHLTTEQFMALNFNK